MADPLRFELLGPLRAWRADAEVPLGGVKQQTVLAVLLLAGGRPVSVDTIVTTVWGGSPPASVLHLVQTYVSRLRQALGLSGRLISTDAGYLLRLDPEQLDRHCFDRHVAAARQHHEHGDHAAASGEITAALALWRGDPLAGLHGEAVDTARHRLAELHLAAAELKATVDLEAGRPAEAVTELTRLTQAHPLQERLWTLLMLALYRADRQAEALQMYAAARAHLVGELGVEPGPGLARMQQRILAADPALTPRARTRNDLPADVADFTGREPELTRLLTALHPPLQRPAAALDPAPPPAAIVLAIDGMAGVGKSTLAVHLAHRLADRYPGGQLHLDLHAYSENRPPIDPSAALDLLLRALDVPGDDIPAGLDERAAAWRSALAGRQVLLVLDNAASAAQVRPLLPGTAGCLTLVTSRRRLPDLDTTDVLSLDVLPAEDAADLFTRILRRPETVDGRRTSSDVHEVVGLCDRLPLAIRIAAARLRARPAWTVPHLADRLRDRRRTLTELAVGDRSVAASLALSYAQLTPDQQRLFRLLGLIPGASFDPGVAAALLTDNTTTAKTPTVVEHGGKTAPESATSYHCRPTAAGGADAERLLEDLLDAHLVQEPAPGRFRFHDLIRQHARAAASAEERVAATRRMLDHYLDRATAAADAIAARDRQLASADARAWLDLERANLIAAVALAADEGWPAHAGGLATALRSYLDTGTHHVEGLAVHGHALKAALAAGDRSGEGVALRNLAKVCWRLGRYEEADAHLRQALPIHRETGDRAAEANALETLGATGYSLGRYDDAIDCYRAAAEIHRAAGDRVAEATVLNNTGVIQERQGRYREVLALCEQARLIFVEHGDRPGEADALGNAGNALWRLGRYDEALDHLTRSLAIHRETGDTGWEAHTLTSLGNVLSSLGRPDEGAEHCDRALELQRGSGERADEAATLGDRGVIRRALGRHDESLADLGEALAIAREIGDACLEIQALNGLGETLSDLGRAAEAGDRHTTALGLAEEIGDRHEQARAHAGLARASGQAAHDDLAQAIYQELGVPEARSGSPTSCR